MKVYGPNDEQERVAFLTKLREILLSYDYGEYIIIRGDFNNTLSNINKTENTLPLKNRAKLNEIIDELNLCDIRREQQ